MTDLKVGIVGLGNRGLKGWLPCWKTVKGARVTAVCDKIEHLVNEGLKKAADTEVKGFTDFEKMLKDADIDAVCLVVEPESQPALAVEALNAGKHVCSEVPLAYTFEECWDIVLAVEKTGLTFAMAEQVSHTPLVDAWKKLVDEGTLGKILYAEGEYTHGMTANRYWHDPETGRRITWEEARNTPGAYKSRFWELKHPVWYLPHDLAPMLRIVDDRVTEVTAMGTRPQSYVWDDFDLPDLEVALMKLSKDTIYRQLNLFTAPTPLPYHWSMIQGTRGQVETNRSGTSRGNEDGLWYLADNYMTTRKPMNWTYTHHQPPLPEAVSSGHGGKDYYPFFDFVQAIANDRPPVVDVYRAADVSAAGAAAGISIENGSQPVTTPDFRPNDQRKPGQSPKA